MVKAHVQSVDPGTDDRLAAWNGPSRWEEESLSTLRRLLVLLRYSHIPLTAFRLSIAGLDPAIIETALRQASGGTGYAAMLDDGEVLYVHVGEPNARVDRPDELLRLKQRILAGLEHQLRSFRPVYGAFEIDAASVVVWSDEISDVRDLISLVMANSTHRYIVTNPVREHPIPGDRAVDHPVRIAPVS